MDKKNIIIRFASWITDRNVPFGVTSIGLIVMLLWAGAYKMTVPGADGIVPLVTNSPLISWDFKIFGTYHGSDLIGISEWTSALLILAGIFKPEAGIIGGTIGVVIFFTTSTMIITTPGTIAHVGGIAYMSVLGLFLFKDFISMGTCFYLISYFGKKAKKEK